MEKITQLFELKTSLLKRVLIEIPVLGFIHYLVCEMNFFTRALNDIFINQSLSTLLFYLMLIILGLMSKFKLVVQFKIALFIIVNILLLMHETYMDFSEFFINFNYLIIGLLTILYYFFQSDSLLRSSILATRFLVLSNVIYHKLKIKSIKQSIIDNQYRLDNSWLLLCIITFIFILELVDDFKKNISYYKEIFDMKILTELCFDLAKNFQFYAIILIPSSLIYALENQFGSKAILGEDYYYIFDLFCLMNEKIRNVFFLIILDLTESFISIFSIVSLITIVLWYCLKFFKKLANLIDNMTGEDSIEYRDFLFGIITWTIFGSWRFDITRMRGNKRVANFLNILFYLIGPAVHVFEAEISKKMHITLGSIKPKRYIKSLIIISTLWCFIIILIYLIAYFFWKISQETSIVMIFSIIELIANLTIYTLDNCDQIVLLNIEKWIVYVKGFTHLAKILILIYLCSIQSKLVFESFDLFSLIILSLNIFLLYKQIKEDIEYLKMQKQAKKMISSISILTETKYNSLDKENKNRIIFAQTYDEFINEDCMVCLNRFGKNELRITECFHVFHTKCLQKWIQIKQTCPVCNQHILI